jgi:hypothetical protein
VKCSRESRGDRSKILQYCVVCRFTLYWIVCRMLNALNKYLIGKEGELVKFLTSKVIAIIINKTQIKEEFNNDNITMREYPNETKQEIQQQLMQ